jgi:hypothetical protein
MDYEDVAFHEERKTTMGLNEGKKLMVFWSGGALDDVEGVKESNSNGGLDTMLKECGDGFDGKIAGRF